jgi:hypothetical protein
MEGDDDSGFFVKNIYTGRLTYYVIKLNRELSTNCENNDCNLCVKSLDDYCITCKFNYTLSQEKLKNCIHLDEATESMTEKMTESMTEKMTEKMTESMTEKMTEKMTESMTESMTEKMTEKMTEAMTEKITEKMTEAMTEAITENMAEAMSNRLDENECSEEKILNNQCLDGEMSENQTNYLYKYLESKYVNKNLTDKDIIVQTKNVLFEISSHDTQKNNNNPNVSSIDLGECEHILKSHYHIDKSDDLIILKTDIKSTDLSKTFVQYQVYHPYKLIPLELSLCNNEKIIVKAPAKLDESTSSLYDSLKQSGYNLFNKSDAFYTDECSVYTSQHGTDMTLEDRKEEIFFTNANASICQDNCELLNYDSLKNRVDCQCSPQVKKVDINSTYSDNKFNWISFIDDFQKTLHNANFRILKCYKLAFDFQSIFTNIGRIFMSIVILLHFITLIIFYFYDFKNIDRYLLRISQFKSTFSAILKIKNKKKNGDKRSKGTKEKIFSIHKEENGPPKKKHSLSNSKIAFPDISIKSLLNGNQEPKKENKKKAKRINSVIIQKKRKDQSAFLFSEITKNLMKNDDLSLSSIGNSSMNDLNNNKANKKVVNRKFSSIQINNRKIKEKLQEKMIKDKDNQKNILIVDKNESNSDKESIISILSDLM